MSNALSTSSTAPVAMANTAQAGALMTRAAQEVQAAMVIAKKFPRDEDSAIARILKSCTRPTLAEAAVYEYEKGGQKITGPSVRLAEAVAQSWGNIDSGIIELEQKSGESQVMAYAWDLETNTRETKIFTVPHIRHTKRGSYSITDPREIYELIANNGARRRRACILGVVPGDVVQLALEQCDRTLQSSSKDPIEARLAKALQLFESVGVTREKLEAKLCHKWEASTQTELARMQKVFGAIRDGFTTVEEQFPAAGANVEKKAKQDAEAEKDEAALFPEGKT